MVDVAHDGDDRRAQLELARIGLLLLEDVALERADLHVEVELVGDELGRRRVQHLVDGGHDAQVEERLDHLAGLVTHRRRELADGHGFRQLDQLALDLDGRLGRGRLGPGLALDLAPWEARPAPPVPRRRDARARGRDGGGGPRESRAAPRARGGAGGVTRRGGAAGPAAAGGIPDSRLGRRGRGRRRRAEKRRLLPEDRRRRRRSDGSRIGATGAGAGTGSAIGAAAQWRKSVAAGLISSTGCGTSGASASIVTTFLRVPLAAVADPAAFFFGAAGSSASPGAGLGLGRPLGLGLFGQVPAAAQLDPQLIRRRRLQRAHRPHRLLAHRLEGDDQILAGDAQLLREVDDLDSCRHSLLTSSPCRSRPGRSESPPRPMRAARRAA